MRKGLCFFVTLFSDGWHAGDGKVPSYDLNADADDLLQLGGTFVVGPEEEISLWHCDNMTGSCVLFMAIFMLCVVLVYDIDNRVVS